MEMIAGLKNGDPDSFIPFEERDIVKSCGFRLLRWRPQVR